jgi:hypothetical protein
MDTVEGSTISLSQTDCSSVSAQNKRLAASGAMTANLHKQVSHRPLTTWWSHKKHLQDDGWLNIARATAF